ncbi:hypothetical protein JVU11DRAFT_7000 [Chiua virens]|nr:hypothetical protein JVU11DRAFT_7000 [Chiua virens]
MSASYPGYLSPTPQPATYNPLAGDGRSMTRTPSPSPSEIESLKTKSMINYRAIFRRDKLLTKKYIIYYVVAIIIAIVLLLFSLYYSQIVHAIQPAANWMHNVRFGWLIPIAIFFVISFPPLFGHEILAIVCGLVWGVGIGFAITAAGTLLGEIGNFYAFRYIFKSRADKEEQKSIQYACLAKIVREGGFKIAVIVRYSAVPGHFTTAIFAVCGMNIFIFVIAALLSMPKQFITVYIGVLLENSANGTTSKSNKILSYVVTGVTILVTVAAMWYIQREINRVKPEVIYARRKARQVKPDGDVLYQNGGFTGSTEDTVFNPTASDVNLTTPTAQSDAPYDATYQQWDTTGHAVGYATDPRVVAPQPRRANASLDAALVAPSLTGNVTGTSSASRHASTDTATWELQANAAEGQSYPLRAMDEPVGLLRNPFDNESSETVIPPSAPQPTRSSTGEYAFSSPQHSFEGNRRPTQFSSPPPSYRG